MKIAIACDHGAYEYKEILKKMLIEEGYEVHDFGCDNKESMDYPDTAAPAARSVAQGANDRGIVLCSTGVGVSIAANKVEGIRCALCTNTTMARLTRDHNDSNMLALGQYILGEEMMKEIVHTWLDTPFSNGERHKRRIAKLAMLEE